MYYNSPDSRDGNVPNLLDGRPERTPFLKVAFLKVNNFWHSCPISCWRTTFLAKLRSKITRKIFNVKYALVKLGGSIITGYKEGTVSFDTPHVHALAVELKKAIQPLIIVHGNGTFGKNVLLKHGIHSDFLSLELGQVALDFNRQSERLNNLLLNIFNEAGLRVAPVALSTTMLRCEDGNISLTNINPIRTLVDAGIIPVIHGGVFSDVYRGFYACSGDKIMSELSKLLKPNVIIFLSDVDGVYEHSPPYYETDSPVEIADWAFWQRMPHNYVVGFGEMHEKLEQALISAPYSDRCYITNGRVPSNIGLILAGKDVGTKVVLRSLDKNLSLSESS